MTNPFASRQVRPGAIPYCFRQPSDGEELLQACAAANFRGAIVGPHGSGKSTLLAWLRRELESRGRRLRLVELHDGQRWLPSGSLSNLERGELVLVDGYEQLAWGARRWLRCVAWRRGAGLLATAHDTGDLPEVFRTETDLSLAREVVRRLTSTMATPVTDEDVAARFEQHAGDLRETLFALYDVHEQRTREES